MCVFGKKQLALDHSCARGTGCWVSHVPQNKDNWIPFGDDHLFGTQLSGYVQQQRYSKFWTIIMDTSAKRTPPSSFWVKLGGIDNEFRTFFL
jgi:hypothetical protein